MENWLLKVLRLRGAKPLGQRKYLHKLIWLGCISVCIPVILASVVYYQFSMNRVKQQIAKESDAALMMMKDRAERVLQGIEQDSLQLAVGPELTDFFNHQAQDNSLIWHRNFLDRIALVKYGNSFIDELYYYSPAEEVVLSNRYGAISKDSYKHSADIDLLLKEGKLSQWAYLPAGQKDGMVTFARMLPVIGGSTPQGVLGIEIDVSAFTGMLEAGTFVLPQGSELLIANYQKLQDEAKLNNQELSGLLAGLPAIAQIRSSDKGADRFFAEGLGGEHAEFLYLKNVYGRTYITVIPEQLIAGQLIWIRVGTILILSFLLVLGIMLTYFITKRAYNPIEQLFRHSRELSFGSISSKEDEFDFIKECLDFLNKETKKLGSYMEKIEPTLREKCIQQLLGGDYSRYEPLLRECEEYGISTSSTTVALAAEAENLTKDKRFLPEDKGIIAFVIANVMQEILQQNEAFTGYAVPYQGRGVALLQFPHDKTVTYMSEQTLRYAEAVRVSLKKALSFEVSVGIGRFYAHVADVPVSYKEADLALQYRVYREADRILYIEELEHAKKQATLKYPRQLEHEMLNALENGDVHNAAACLAQFADAMRESESYVFIYQSYHMLLSAAIASLEQHGGSIADIVEHNLFGQLKDKLTSKEIYDWFEETVFPLYKWLTENYRSDAAQTLIQRVCRHIRQHCGDDVSLVQCADMVGVSPSYLSRLFKKETGMNFLDFVVECKVEEAKKLLTQTDQTVSDIAEAVGYSERNLSRIFQRLTKMTPSTFRSKHR
ncbi:helix-turn-helix domain-containing protein [Paenibacillus thalictri]|uniref:AraC family transcriptional regulator n=1 Tax=Paenibacillus thalictri TaxID=2527873 RepID=A0A4Q9DUI2_9BACL|nr:helix-turn-helix domain-containing protein [Paenibacillus thalictri]TBL79343.1 AraC family transcriptional regulator [Paenibacillus thalictri]